MKKILFTILTLTLLLSPGLVPTYAQSDDTNQVLTTIDDERTKKLQQELGLTIPLETDNPNHIVTFKDPSGKGIKLEIDGQGFKTIKSPYTLPSLGIGAHILTFKFTDSEQAPQSLEQDLVVVPRTPVIAAPENLAKSEITIKGTALASSTVELFISGDTLNFKSTTEVGSDGTWSHTFKENFKYTVYTVIARTKKNGFSSSISQPVVFELSPKDGANENPTVITQPIYFDFRQINASNLIDVVKNNPHLLVFAMIFAIVGGLITWGVESISTRKVNKTAEGKFIKLLSEKEKGKTDNKSSKNEKKSNTPSGRMTLKEKFEKAGFKLPENQTNEVKKDKEEETLSKEEFLKEYKEQDPDNAKGVETKQAKEEKKKVAVTLTSKKN